MLNPQSSKEKKKADFLFNQVLYRRVKLKIRLRHYLKIWHTKAQNMKVYGSANYIKNYFKIKLELRKVNEKKFDEACDKLKSLAMKMNLREAYEKIKNYAKKARLRQIIMRHLKDIPKEFKKLFLEKFFKRWRGKVDQINKDEAVTKINNQTRKFLARKKLKKFRRKGHLVENILKSNEDKEWQITTYRFYRWKRVSAVLTNQKNANTLHDWIRNDIMTNILKNSLRELFVRYVFDQVKKALVKSTEVDPKRVDTLTQTIKDIYNQKSINKLKDLYNLKKRRTKVSRVLLKYYRKGDVDKLKSYLRLWRRILENTREDDSIRKIQAYLRKRLNCWKNKKNFMKKEFLTKRRRLRMFNNQLNLKLFFKRWKRNVDYDKFHEAAKRIKNKWLSNSRRSAFQKKLNRSKMRELLRYLVIKLICNALRESSSLANIVSGAMGQIDKNLASRIAGNNLLNYQNLHNKNNKLRDLAVKVCKHKAKNCLKKFFGRWKEKIDSNRAEKKREILKKKLKLLMDLNEKNLLYYFRRWRNKCKHQKLDENSNKIKNYLLPKVRRLNKSKLKELVLKLYKRDFFNKVKEVLQRSNREEMKKRFRKLIERKHLKLRNLNLRRCLKLWHDKILKGEKKFELLKRAFLKFRDSNEAILRVFLRHWNYIVKKRKIDKRAKLIQDFTRKIYNSNKIFDFINTVKDTVHKNIKKKYDELINNLKYLKHHDGLNNLTKLLERKIKERKKDALDEIKNYAKEKELEQMYHKMNKALKISLDKNNKVLKHYLRLWRYNSKNQLFKDKANQINSFIRDQVNKSKKEKNKMIKDGVKYLLHYIFLRFIHKMQNYSKRKLGQVSHIVRQKLYQRTLRYWFYLWKTIARKIIQKQSASRIQKNWRLYKNRDSLDNKLRKYVKKLEMSNEDILNRYFKLWHRIAENIKVHKAANAVKAFIGKNLKDIINKNLWGKRQRHLRKIIKKHYGTGNRENLRKYFHKWNTKHNYLADMEYNLSRFVEILEYRRTWIGAEIIENFFIYKKTIDLANVVRMKMFFKKLKHIQDYQRITKKLFNLMNTAKNELEIGKNQRVCDKIYQYYIYKILSTLYARLWLVLKKYADKQKPVFLNRLKKMFFKKVRYNYTNDNRFTSHNPGKQFQFKSRIHVIQIRKVQDSASRTSLYLTPHMNNLFEKLKKKVMRKAFDKINKKRKIELFILLLKMYLERHLFRLKHEFMMNLLRHSKTPNLIHKFYKLLRRYGVRKLTQPLEIVQEQFNTNNKLKKLINLSNDQEERSLIRHLRMWRLKSHLQNIALDKMSKMYQNMQLQFLNLAKDMFGSGNNGIMHEFEYMSEKMGIYDKKDKKRLEFGVKEINDKKK